MQGAPPKVIVLAGPNGAGKTTTSAKILRESSAVAHFVNADAIAAGLSAFDPEAAAMQAGRAMLERLDRLAEGRESFAFETTLASRTFVPRIRQLIGCGYVFELIFLWLPSPELAIARVAGRVRQGGHSIPEGVIRRRYSRGLKNFFGLYASMAARWFMLDNASPLRLRLIASGSFGVEGHVADPALWYKIKSDHDHGNAISKT